MSDMVQFIIPDSLHISAYSQAWPRDQSHDSCYLQEQVLDWLVKRGVRSIDWAVSTGMYIDEQGYKRKSFITFVDDNVAMEFKLTWL
jgi:hypothetical protein